MLVFVPLGIAVDACVVMPRLGQLAAGMSCMSKPNSSRLKRSMALRWLIDTALAPVDDLLVISFGVFFFPSFLRYIWSYCATSLLYPLQSLLQGCQGSFIALKRDKTLNPSYLIRSYPLLWRLDPDKAWVYLFIWSWRPSTPPSSIDPLTITRGNEATEGSRAE